MARKNRKKEKKNKKKANEQSKQNDEKAENRSQKAFDFLRNLGPDGYMRASESLCKNVLIRNYSMSTPDGATPLLENVDIKLNFGRKYVLVGKNGYGKTTLLDNLAFYRVEGFPTHVRMVHVRQECDKNDPRKVIDAVLEADVVRLQLLAEAERLENQMYEQEDEETINATQDELDAITTYMDDIQLKDDNARAFKILTGLGFSKKAQKEPISSLSGGWRVRLEIAKALFVNPDLLLLDEPTNHLDFPAVLWLQEHLLTNFKKTLVIVSHDKMFIDAVADSVIHLDHERKALDYYKGNHAAFEASRKEKRQALINAHRAQTVQIEALKEFVAKFKDKGEKRASQVQSKLKTLAKLEEELPLVRREERKLKFVFPTPALIETHLVLFTGVDFSYSAEIEPILKNINLALDMDSRVGVIGANGVGKSTLIKLILGKLKPLKGEIERAERLKTSYFSQHHYDQLDFSKNAVEYFLEKFAVDLSGKEDRVQFVRRHLGKFGIKGDRQNQKMALLSGGQKSRVAFAVMTFQSPHLIVMDEPTNHLDIETIEALLNAIEEYKGGIIVISHDTHFLSKVANDFWSLTPEKIVRFRDFDEAKKHALQKRIDEILSLD